ncbi:sugar ABC transporter substrate-binding protein [Microbacterium candidum]|uniref:Sugar ABC transporter substrate-binding protein n=1 Tax=Microbacterium candidum TaxID=3041922 RepID=A0ABT7MW32_9MICO|nr:sugar ABC transporter substrate-binding protein [Microbacterium sp. ASV49]MDL9978672.1 sugar ABC transporter substrate-binding protein [Microbacterium sp. ASV49]
MATAVALVGCSNTASTASPSDSHTLEIAFFNPVATNTYTAANLRGVEAAAKEVGAHVTKFDAAFDPTTQVSQVQDALTKGGYDMFVINPLNPAALAPVMTQARSKGVEVVSLLSTIGTDNTTLQSSVDGLITVGVDLAQTGKYIGGLIVDACAGIDPCKVAYMPGDSAQASDQLRTAAVKKTLAAHSSIELVSEQPGGFDRATGLATAQNILTAHPDLNVIAAASGQPIAGAMQAIEQVGRTGKITVVSNGATEEDIAGIRAGTIYGAPLSLPYTEGYEGVKLALKARSGEKVPTAVSVLDYSKIGPVATKKTLSTDAGKAFQAEWTAG